ncbi:hypothetical protein [Streptomyces sp. Isolate_219]|uniref:hypothetical protein n=1 Tax=Streptomyces sp. Isolate_219 TaxID=2950110 RepID=UPI0021C9CA00|nr:hypothetical protein [Streptomyces sp. Isolate_219]MCR8576434.1 hypothetical protein [Streptomyces sp. Isolate_219]
MSGTVYDTSHGYTVEATRRGVEVDLITRNAKGEVISTVIIDYVEAQALLFSLGEAV